MREPKSSEASPHQVGEAWEEFVQEQVYPEPGKKAKEENHDDDL